VVHTPALAVRATDRKFVGIAIWLVGVVLSLVRVAWLSLRLTRRVGRCAPVDDSDLNQLLAVCCGMAGVRRRPGLLWGPPDAGPALVGIWRPKLLLPACVKEFSAADLRVFLLHELAHLKRRDVAVNHLIAILQAFHWFNPFVWAAFSRMRADRELACDEAVLRLTPLREWRAYGCTILKLLEVLGRGRLPAGAMGVVGNKGLMHRRISMIAKFDANKRRWSPTGLLLSLMLIGAAAVSAVRAQQAALATPPATAPPATTPPAATPVPPQGEVGIDQARQAVSAAASAAPGVAPQPTQVAPVTIEAGPAVIQATPPAAGEPPRVMTTTEVPTSAAQHAPNTAFISNGAPFGVIAAPDGAIVSVEDASTSAANANTAKKLQRPQSFKFEGVSLRDALANLADTGGVDIVIDDNALRTVRIDSSKSDLTMMIHEPRPLEQQLQLVLRLSSPHLDYSLVNGVVLISTRTELARHVITRAYGIGPQSDRGELTNLIQSTLGGDPVVRLAYVGDRLLVTASEPAQRQLARLLALVGDQTEHRVGDVFNSASPHTSIYRLKNANAQSLASAINSTSPRIKLIPDERTNSLLITGPEDEQNRAMDLIQRLDQPANEANRQSNGMPDAATEIMTKMQELALQARDLAVRYGPDNPKFAEIADQLEALGQRADALCNQLAKEGHEAEAAKLRDALEQIKAMLGPPWSKPVRRAPEPAK
jgi:beta-lactamase regulating signal transducer with metallopeptidase domain